MNWIKNIFSGKDDSDIQRISQIQEKFSCFMTILENNNIALKTISDMEEKAQGEYVFDINYIRNSVEVIFEAVRKIISNMIALGGERYDVLNDIYYDITNDVHNLIHLDREIGEDKYIYRLSELGRDNIFNVGNKMAQLGEIKSRLDLPAPNGFAITAWAYKRFLQHNGLQNKITERIKNLNLRNIQDLDQVSHDIRQMILEASLPDDLATEIMSNYELLRDKHHTRTISVRSSAIGEDSALSFAGQYETFLNVKPHEILDSYKGVVASKFSANAIYYFLSHSINEDELAMCVGCLEMVGSVVSGVIYSRDPVNPDGEYMIINSIFGQGRYLVDGIVQPDSFRVSRQRAEVLETRISKKKKQLVLKLEGGTVNNNLPPEQQKQPSLNRGQLLELRDIALKLEDHYGTPMDIEWSINSRGQIYILQARQLGLVQSNPVKDMPDTANYELQLSNAQTICPGAGMGQAYSVNRHSDLDEVPSGCILIAATPFPDLLTIINRARALVTETGSIASHIATVVREYRIPAIVGGKEVRQISSGSEITVDACNGRIYKGLHPELVEALEPDFDFFEDDPIFTLLKSILLELSPLSLIQPESVEFQIENCLSIHDIIRYSHQMSMGELFREVTRIYEQGSAGISLKSDIPLKVNIVYLDRDKSYYRTWRSVKLKDLDCPTLKSFWQGMMTEGWPTPIPKEQSEVKLRINSKQTQAFACGDQQSYVLLSDQFMLLNLKMGYHFTTYEAMSTDNINQNYIKMQFKEGGATLDRRVRRIKLITEVLTRAGFKAVSKGDFLDASHYYISKDEVAANLYLLGRLAMLSKQLDMALSNDPIAKWYTEDIIRKLKL